MAAKTCAFLTMANPGDFVTDYDVGFDAMAALGWNVDTVLWRDSSINWDAYDAVYICTPWDYPQHKDEFIDVLQNIEDSSAVLVNPLCLVHWSLAKRYLRDLEQRGADIVPSIWFDDIAAEQVPGWFETLGTDTVVIKPEVGANAQDTYVLRNPVASDTVSMLLDKYRRRPFFVQPFLANVQSEGEFSLFFFSGNYSHAIVKVPRSGDFRSQEEYGAEIRSMQPSEQLLAAGQHVLSLVEPEPVYVRADFVRDNGGRFLLIELELIEPSLYLRMDRGAAARFAAALDEFVFGSKA